MKHNRSLK